MNKKILALLLVFMMAFTATLPAVQADADDEEDNDLSDSIIIKILEAIHNKSYTVELTDDHAANRAIIVDLINSVLSSESGGIVITEEFADMLVGYFATMVLKYVVSDDFEYNGGTDIDAGYVKAASDIPQYMIDLISGKDTEVDYSKMFAECGLSIDLNLGCDVNTDGLDHIGLDISGMESSPISSLLTALIGTDNPDAFNGMDVVAEDGSIYSASANLKLLTYLGIFADSNIGKTDKDPYAALRIVLNANGKFGESLNRVSGTGPESIRTGLELNNLSLDLVVDIAKNGSKTNISLTINKALIDAKYYIGADGDYKETAIHNSNLMAMVNGTTIVVSGDRNPVTHEVSIITDAEMAKARADRSQTVNDIIDEAKDGTENETEEIDRTIPLIVSAVLAIVGIAVISAVKFGKKY